MLLIIKKPFVVYRKPNETVVKAIFQRSDEFITNTNLSESGFVFAPFDIPACRQGRENPSIFFPLTNSEQIESIFLEEIFSEKNHELSIQNKTIDKDFHIKLVKKAIDAIEKKEFKKVVISRKEEVKISDFNLIKTYHSLLQKYPAAMVYCWFHPKVGLWMGATPELLCKIDGNHFYTMALAGTQLVTENEIAKWNEKEIIEQQLVTNFIVNELKSEIKNLKISVPYSVKAGHLWHIRTDITGEISSDISIEKIIQKLHPTPAVCGFPKQAAKDFIIKNENYNRLFYTGYFGEINVDNTSELFVNLRCMQVSDNTISIYIGGGITHDSNPDKEWEETIAKANSMKSVFY